MCSAIGFRDDAWPDPKGRLRLFAVIRSPLSVPTVQVERFCQRSNTSTYALPGRSFTDHSGVLLNEYKIRAAIYIIVEQ